VVARSRVSNSDVLQGLSFPNMTNPGNPENLNTFHSEPAMDMIEDWRNDRLTQMRDAQNLPKFDHALNNVITTRMGSNELELLQSYLPDPLSDNEVRRQIQIALAAYKAGIAISATFGINGFDTHDNNDSRQNAARSALFNHVAFMWDEAERQGLSESIICVMGSDFARTPGYNNRNGKDHHSITSMMVMGYGVEGNRTVGGTDSGQNARRIDPNTLSYDDSGMILRPAHIHAALREVAGVSAELDQKFPLNVDPIPGLLGTA